MIQVSRPQLKAIYDATDTNNPKPEFNYAYVDENYIVSTNTQVMTTVRHDHSSIFTTFNYKPFYISKQIMGIALKIKQADAFLLDPDVVHCASFKDVKFELSIKDSGLKTLSKYPDYKRIINSTTVYTAKDLFIRPEHIPGILATHRIDIDLKFVSKALSEGTIESTTSDNIPVRITDTLNDITSIIMPLSSTFKGLETSIANKGE